MRIFIAIIAIVACGALASIAGQQRESTAACRISGSIRSGAIALPGVTILLTAADKTVAATSTESDGRYRIVVEPGAYHTTASLFGFAPIERDVIVDAANCSQTIDFELTLAPATSRAAGRTPAATAPRADSPARGASTPPTSFESVALTELASGAQVAQASVDREAEEEAMRRLLPPGFSADAPTQAVAFAGNVGSVDRDMLGERMQAMGRGEFGPITGDLPPGLGTPGVEGAAGGFQDPGRGGAGGPGGGAGRGGGRGGRGGPGDFAIGGRGGRQNSYNASANYTFGGSALDASPYQLRANAPAGRAPYTRQTFGGTVGGPVKIPKVYDGTRRTNFTFSYNGNRGDELFDQFATVPDAAMRAGNFSSLVAQLFDPRTGQPLAGNQIPAALMSPSALALLRYLPSPNLPGATKNFHYTTTTDSIGDNVSGRITHNFTPAVAGRGGAGGRGGAPGGRGGGGFGRGGRGQAGTSVVVNAQVNYRRSNNERVNVFPTLGGRNESSSLALPVSANIAHRRMLHNVSMNVSRTTNASINQYAFVEDVAGTAGIRGVAADPFAWGVPDLSFSTFSSLRDLTPSQRSDRRITTSYNFTRPFNRHTLRFGGDYRWDVSNNRTDSNARGAFVFTGLYSSGGAPVARSGLDFADFLLGVPQQASLQYGPGNVRLTGRSMSLFVQDDWRRSSSLTFNLGVRYELLLPFVEGEGRMVNLDAAPDFTAVAPVVAGGTGPFSGKFPRSLLLADTNNIAPRVSVAWRVAQGTVIRAGYGLSFNAGSYSSIARQLVSQPPFAVSNTAIGTRASPLDLTNPLATASPNETTNNYGVQRDYALGSVHTWNAVLSRDLQQVWNLGAGYTHTRGSHLDILRAPNRGPAGLRIEGVQPFIWQSSEGSSVLHAATLRVRRRVVNGIGGGASYTLARSRDNASSLGGGGGFVAQDDRNLEAEWGLSSFDRRHQLATDLNIELPFGENRRWLDGGGVWAAILENWRATANFVWQSGTPLTPRVAGAAADVARGTNGTLRANYDGQRVQISNPTIDRFFNTAAFSIPATGTFGTASRNMIIGPGSKVLNAQLSRDVRLGQRRVLTIVLNSANVLNAVNFGAIDTVVNSPTFGQVLSVRQRRSTTLSLRFRF